MKTEIINIIDRSGSMQFIDKDACGGFNTFIKEQREVPGEARVTTILFDHLYEASYQGISLSEVPHMTTLGPRGNTALLDAIGKTLNDQGKRIADEGWADLVIVCILTDGGENASREFNRAAIRRMVTHAQEHGWTFVFLAANQDAFAAADSYGIARTHTHGFAANSAGTTAAYASISSTTRQLRGTTF